MNLHNNDFQQLPFKLRSLIELESESGETLTWYGRPNTWRFVFRSAFRSTIALIVILCTAFLFFGLATSTTFQIPDFKEGFDIFTPFIFLFLFIGVAVLCSPLLLVYKAKRIIYVLTTSRAIIFDSGVGIKTITYTFDELMVQEI